MSWLSQIGMVGKLFVSDRLVDEMWVGCLRKVWMVGKAILPMSLVCKLMVSKIWEWDCVAY